MLNVSNLNAGYGKAQVLYNINFGCKLDGEVVTIIGPNGSGKTTFLNSIFGLADVFSGKITFDNISLRDIPSHEVVKTGLGYLRQESNVFETLSVEENLKMGGASIKKKKEVEERIDEVLSFIPFVKPFLLRRASTLSGGERQLVALSMILTSRPKLIMLDEPTAGLAPVAIKQVVKVIERLKDENISLIIIEQNLKYMLDLSDKSCLIVSGRNIFTGPSDKFLEQSDLKMYLGLN